MDKYKTKFFIVFFVLVIISSLMACGKNDSETNTNNKSSDNNSSNDNEVVHLRVGVVGEESIEWNMYGTHTYDGTTFEVEEVLYDSAADLNTAIISGEGPDLIDLYRVPYSAYLKKDMLIDLKTVFANQGQDEYFENVLNLTKVGDTYRSIIVSYSLSGMCVDKELVGDRTSWTIDEFVAIMEDSGEIYDSYLQSFVLQALFEQNYTEFIDEGSNTASFSSDEFTNLLEFVNRYAYSESDLSGGVGNISFFDFHFPFELAFNRNDIGYEPVYIGCPSNQSSAFTIDLSAGLEISVLSTSENQDGAKKFVEYLLSEEYQSQSDCMPVRKDCLSTFLTNVDKYVDSDGITEEEVKELKKSMLLSEEEIELVRDLVENADNLGRYEDTVYSIIEEESAPFFSGDKTAKEVADIIQNRVTSYLDELE